MVESGLMIRCLKYDSDIYADIIKHGRLVPIDLGKLKILNEQEALENARGLVESLSFSNKYVFDTMHLGAILKVHTPLNATAYHERCKDNILTLTFYKI